MNGDTNRKTETPSFECSLEELEEIVSQLEAGEKPLDQSLGLYEKGIAALKRCHTILDQAEKKITLLTQNSAGEPVLRDASPTDDAHEQKVPAVSSEGADNLSKSKEKNGKEAGRLKKSGRQPVDSGPPLGQDAVASSQFKTKSSQEKAGAGGSLFGSEE